MTGNKINYPSMLRSETPHERMVREMEEQQEYVRSTHKADGNDIQRIEQKLNKILAILEKL